MNKRKIVYLADDDEDDRQLIKDAISAVDMDTTVVEAVDGEDLLQKISETAPHIALFIILDMNMPRLNGLEALKAIRSDVRTKATPTIMFIDIVQPSVDRKGL